MSTGFLPRCDSLAVPASAFADHRNRRPHGPILVVVVRHGKAEDRHDGVADELVEHARPAADAVHHDGEVLVEEGSPCRARPSSSLIAVKVRMSENRTVAVTLSPPSASSPPASSMIGRTRVHVARHGRLHALLVADVLDHQQRTELLAGAVLLAHQWQRRQVDGHLFSAGDQRRVHRESRTALSLPRP